MASESFAACFKSHYAAGRCAPAYRQFQGQAGGSWTGARFVNALNEALKADGMKAKSPTTRTVANWQNGTLPQDIATLHAILAVLFDPDNKALTADHERMRRAWYTGKGRELPSEAGAGGLTNIGETRTAPDSPWEVRGHGKAARLVEFVLPPPRPDNDGGSLVTGTLLISEETISARHPHQPDATLDFCIGLRGAELSANAKGGITGLDTRAQASHPHLAATATGWSIEGPLNPLRSHVLDGDVIAERQLVRLMMDATQQGSVTFEVIAQAGAFTVLPPRFVNEPMPVLSDNKQALVSAFLEKRFKRDANGRVVLAQQLLVWRGLA